MRPIAPENMADEDSKVIDLAININERLASIARGVGQRLNDGFCSALSAALWLINDQLKTPATRSKVSISRLLKILTNFERLCKPKSFCTKCSPRQPTASTKRSRVGVKPLERYPSLLCENSRSHAVEGIRRMAVGRSEDAIERRQGLLRILQAFSSPLSKEMPVPEISTKRDDIKDDLTNSIRILYEVLSKHSKCSAGEDVQKIATKLRLAIESSHDLPVFDLLFLAHPHHEINEKPYRWRDTRIHVERRKTKFKASPQDQMGRLIESGIMITDLCEKISTNDQYQLSLVVSNQELQFIEWCEGARSWVPNCPSVSLATILKNHSLSKKMKYLLSYLLANYVWQFYHTEWVRSDWTKGNIQFMFERRGGAEKPGIFLNEPFVSASFDIDQLADTFERRPHKFPKLKSLGIVLLEIELSAVIEDHYGPECYGPDGELNDDADLYAALQLFDNPDNLEDTFPVLKTVIGDCLRPSKFLPHRFEEDQLRDLVKEAVVDPLHTVIELYDRPEKVKVRPIMQLESSQLNFKLPNLMKPPNCGTATFTNTYSHAKPANIEVVRQSQVENTSESWFGELDKLNGLLSHLPGELDIKYRRVRVAVIDTGINESDIYARHISGYRDFVSGIHDKKQDNTGHGTSSVKLILKAFAQAEIYVARVFENQQANEDTQHLMEQAVKYAHETWKVDVISIASGFEQDYNPLRIALKRAAADGILVFAAASNYGNVRQVTFPARMRDVICVFCTDGRAKISASINPAPQTTKSRNFAILGERVVVPPNAHATITGTSVATSIAAGVAGRLLDFSRQGDCRRSIRCVENLASIEGISAVFSEMARGADDQKYNCIVPWRLLQHLDEGTERQIQRQRICEKLSAALENMDLD